MQCLWLRTMRLMRSEVLNGSNQLVQTQVGVQDCPGALSVAAGFKSSTR